MDTAFNGEHPLPGQLGQIFIILSFGASLFSAISYYFSAKNIHQPDDSWKRLGRIGFYVNTVSVIGIGVSLFYIIYNHLFEYHYAWAHSSTKLPVHYIISCFWEGQEGSFWLWAFWQSLIGVLLTRKARSWEGPVMTVVAFSQAMIVTMLLGIEIFGERIGSSPFILLRDALPEAPIFKTPDYLQYVKDGNGLNPLLQNYWMVIHPPTLFLGFASVIVPFAYAVAGLWQKRYKEWIQPAISYTLFGVMILGTGIIMGAFWAYESLNFGGFWAWDPVENASLFPWITLVGALHVLIVFKNTGHSYFTATLLTLLSFVLVLYASFLTRSGILGETSVHAFTDLGMKWHLVIDVLIFLALSTVLLVIRRKELPITKKDEETHSREFWMFVGSVMLALSCLQLLVVTSIPVWNWIFGTNWAPPIKVIPFYNMAQGCFAIIITILTGITQFLKYKKTETPRFFITMVIYLVLAAALTGLVAYITGVYKMHIVFILVMFGSFYTLLANFKVLADVFSGKVKLAGSAVAHIGFGFMMVGGLIAAGTSRVVSENNSGEDYGAAFAKTNNPKENILLYKNEPVRMADYIVTYVGDSLAGPNNFFKVEYKQVDESGKVLNTFMLKPNSQSNPKMGLVSSPDTKHYLLHDLYTHITMAPENTFAKASAEEAAHGEEGHDDEKNYDAPIVHEVAEGDTITYRDGIIVFRGLNKQAKLQNMPVADGDVAVGAKLDIVVHDKTYQAEPVYLIKGRSVYDFAKKVDELGLKLRFSKILPEKNKVEITVYQQPQAKRPYIVMKAIRFPYINFLWSGTILMVIGTIMAMFRRNKELKVS